MKNNLDIKLIEKVIEIPSLSQDHKKCLAALEVLLTKLKQEKIPCKIVTLNKFPCLIAGKCNNKTAFLSHIDVVPGTTEQFTLKQKDDRILGRGVLDMKGPLVVAFSVFIELWKNNFKNFLFVVTSDEEIGGFNGAAKLSKTILKEIKEVIILDSTAGEKLVLVQKAPFHIKITHKGRLAHGSRPWEGINSVNKVAKCSLKIEKKINNNSSEKTSAAITQIQGGQATNIIPDYALSTLDIRIKSKNEIEQVTNIVNSCCKENHCQWEKIDEPLFVEISPNNSFIKKWFLCQPNRQTIVESGASDARFLVNQNLPAIITSARGGGAHTKNEWVSQKSLIKLKNILLKFCKMVE